MKNWKKIMAMLCTAAMLTGSALPVWAEDAAETEDESYCLLWEAMNAAFEQLGAQGCTTANCVFTDGMIILMR